MKSISIRELHLHTGKWVREASKKGQQVVVLDRGRPTARLLPLEEHSRTPFSRRGLVDGFGHLPEIQSDSGQILEEERR